MGGDFSALEVGQLHSELVEIWRRLLNSSDISVDDDFFECGGDSLLATDLVLEIEAHFGRSVPHSVLFEASTVRSLAELLVNSPELEPKVVSQVTAPGEQTPLLFFHGDWTNGGFFVKKLVGAFGAEQPLIAVAPHGLAGERIPESLEQMAAERLLQILSVQPQGPYRLGGHCVGGMVALETARLLVERGHEIEVLAMIDPIWTADGEPWPRLELPMPPAPQPAPADVVEELPADEHVPVPGWEQYGAALKLYSPAPLPIPILVFSSEFDGAPWSCLSTDFSLFQNPGDHYDWVTNHAALFASHVSDLVARQSASEAAPVQSYG